MSSTKRKGKNKDEMKHVDIYIKNVKVLLAHLIFLLHVYIVMIIVGITY